MKLSLFIFLAAAVLGPELCLATLHNITVKGELLCDNATVSNVKVELREHDTFDPDDTINAVHTDSSGRFEIFGEEDERKLTTFYLRIFHKCDATHPKVCTRATEYDVPEKKLDSVYDMGSISLNLQDNKELGRRYDRDSEECD
ncbi:transthyretin-like family domain-containing protein [Ditylenchus destructor]|uniref:Transthyretin-like family domain-containing protein n=1 Tax=Ditylenchus destructor TaxID=166010 RepID=A0AAD4R912_9BILA|nr:transthyretin-like family domain-containing protein [Ditylenchus destructor]